MDADIDEVDRTILGYLRSGRVTPAYLEKRLDRPRPEIDERLARLEDRGVVANLEGVGLYELQPRADVLGG